MSLKRLKVRVPSTERLGGGTLKAHQLRFHKVSHDGSSKCDAFQTDNEDDFIIGSLYQIDEDEKTALDQVEGLGHGYEEKVVRIENQRGEIFDAFIYYATNIGSSLKPYAWYVNHVIIGAKEINVPLYYLNAIQAIECIEDPNKHRDSEQRAIYL